MIQDLLARRATAWGAMQEIQSRAEQDKRAMTAEERESWDKAEAEIRDLSETIRRLEQSARMQALDAIDAGEAGAPASPEGRGAETGTDDAARYSRAFGQYLRRGLGGIPADDRDFFQARFETPDELRALSSVTGSAGGYTVPEGFWAKITETMKAFGGLLGVANVLDTATGASLPWPGSDDTSNAGAILSEGSAATEQDIAFTTHTLGAYTYTSKIVRVPLQLLQDSGVDIEAFVARRLGIRLGRALAAHLATGTGTSQPAGITGAAGFSTGKTGAAGQVASVIYDDLIDLIHSVDAAYRQGGNCRFALADATLGVLRKLKDSQGRPLWEPSLQVGQADQLLGYPVTVDNGIPTPAASAKSIAFGDFQSGYVVRRVAGGQLMRLSERYAEYLQVAFLAFGRFDAVVDDSAAVKLYAHPAS